MLDENKNLAPAQARHLTEHGMNQNEDGTFCWKNGNYVRNRTPHDVTGAELEDIWGKIKCPTLHVYGSENWMEDLVSDGRISLFQNAQLAKFEGAGH